MKATLYRKLDLWSPGGEVGPDRERARTFCRMCQGRCGLLATVKAGKVVKVEGDRESPLSRGNICAKGRAWPQILNHPHRLQYPQRRQGEKGEGRWVRISWEEALSTIADRLKDFRREFGPQCVVLGLGDPKGLELAFAQRFASAFGTPNITTPGHVCHMPRELASAVTYGSPCRADNEHPPRLIVVWGSNMLHTHDATITRSNLRAALNKGAKLLVIDPQRTNLASRAHLWIRPRPGSDGALALGMIRVVIEEGLYDQQFVDQWTIGFDELKDHVTGYPLDRVEELTWVPRQQIAEAARLYAQTKPTTIQWGNALDQSTNSFQTCRAIAILRAICGNIDIPGGEIIPTPLPLLRPGRFMLLREFPREPGQTIGGECQLAARSAFVPRQSVIKAILEEKPYPVKAALLFGTNPLLTYPHAREVYDALMKLEFLVVAELFMTPTAALADIVLPAATNFEFDELGPYPSPVLLAYPKIVEPPGECWSDMKIINELAKRVGLGEHFWSEERDCLDVILEPSGLTFDQFKRKGMLQAEEKGYRKYEKGGFRTPSGKVEIFCQQLQDMGFSPLPIYTELELAEGYPLVLTSGKEPSFCHAAHRNIPRLRRIARQPIAQLNPETAARLGMKEGDWMYIETERGRIRQRLSLNRDLDPRVVIAAYGWWFPERGASELYGWSESNINLLTESAAYEPAVGSVNLRGLPCRISKEASPK